MSIDFDRICTAHEGSRRGHWQRPGNWNIAILIAMAKKNDWKDREGVVYSTSDNFEYEFAGKGEQATLPPQQQNLRVQLDKNGRAGKQVTLVTGFVGSSR